MTQQYRLNRSRGTFTLGVEEIEGQIRLGRDWPRPYKQDSKTRSGLQEWEKPQPLLRRSPPLNRGKETDKKGRDKFYFKII